MEGRPARRMRREAPRAPQPHSWGSPIYSVDSVESVNGPGGTAVLVSFLGSVDLEARLDSRRGPHVEGRGPQEAARPTGGAVSGVGGPTGGAGAEHVDPGDTGPDWAADTTGVPVQPLRGRGSLWRP